MVEHTIYSKNAFDTGYRRKQGYLYAFVRWLRHSTEKPVTRSDLSRNKQSFADKNMTTETIRLLALEKCANATRDLEAFDQYDWINSSDAEKDK